jgi:hypothetical protein
MKDLLQRHLVNEGQAALANEAAGIKRDLNKKTNYYELYFKTF